MICEQNVDELKRIFNRKFPNKLSALERFLAVALVSLELVPTPEEEELSELRIRDENDRPILRAAVKAGADVLLTGDKDFLEAGIETPAILSPGEFIRLMSDETGLT